MNPIDFEGHSSKVKVMGIIDKCGVAGMLRFALLYLIIVAAQRASLSSDNSYYFF